MIKIITLVTKFIIVAFIALLFHSCNIKTDFGSGEEGNTKIITEIRNIKEDFSSIDVNSGIEVVIEQSADKFISVETDSNLLKLIDTKVVDGVLHIEPNKMYNSTEGVKVVIRMPKIESLEASSGSTIKGKNSFKGENISIDTSSAAEVDVNLQYYNVICLFLVLFAIIITIFKFLRFVFVNMKPLLLLHYLSVFNSFFS